VNLHFQSAAGQFTLDVSFSHDFTPSRLVVGDLNGDTLPDITYTDDPDARVPSILSAP
jgi:hypothetical protein